MTLLVIMKMTQFLLLDSEVFSLQQIYYFNEQRDFPYHFTKFPLPNYVSITKALDMEVPLQDPN